MLLLDLNKKGIKPHTLSRPVIAEKSNGLGANPAPGEVGDLLDPDCDSPEDASGFELFLSAALVFSSKKYKVLMRNNLSSYYFQSTIKLKEKIETQMKIYKWTLHIVFPEMVITN